MKGVDERREQAEQARLDGEADRREAQLLKELHLQDRKVEEARSRALGLPPESKIEREARELRETVERLVAERDGRAVAAQAGPRDYALERAQYEKQDELQRLRAERASRERSGIARAHERAVAAQAGGLEARIDECKRALIAEDERHLKAKAQIGVEYREAQDTYTALLQPLRDGESSEDRLAVIFNTEEGT